MNNRYAFIGIAPMTNEVQVIASADSHSHQHLRDMEGLLVIATTVSQAKLLFGEHVDLSDVATAFALGKSKPVITNPTQHNTIKRSGTG